MPDLIETLERLTRAAENREATMGDPCRLIECQAELREAVAEARDELERDSFYYLTTAAMNERSEWDAITHAVWVLRNTIDRTASRCARERAEWHDDPTADDYDEFHAPADVQFPREERDAAILELVQHYLTEHNLQEETAAQ